MTLGKLGVRVGDMRSARAAADYALDIKDSPLAFEEAGEEGHSRQSTMWLGSDGALAQLGLKRGEEVTSEQLAHAFMGQDLDKKQVRKAGSVPSTGKDGELLLDENGDAVRELRVNTPRMAFGATKEFTELWLATHITGDVVLRAKLEHLMFVAGNGAMEHVVRTRKVVGGKEVAKGFVASMSLHVVARTAKGETVPSPHLHLHIDMVGVEDLNGKLKTPNLEALYKHSAMREAGAVGRALLADGTKRLGFTIEALTGNDGRYFKIVGLSDELTQQFSGRTREVRAWARARVAALGYLSKRDEAQAALLTRTSKRELSPRRVLREWIRTARDCGIGVEEARALLSGAVPEDYVDKHSGLSADELSELIRERILASIWKEGPTVSLGGVQSMAWEHLPLGVSLQQVSAVLGRMQETRELIVVDQWLVTTEEIQAAEQEVRDVAVAAGQRDEGALSLAAVRAGKDVANLGLNGHTLDPEQEDAVDLLTAGRGWSCLTGLAGTGKGPVLEAVAEAHRQDGWKVVAGTVDGATTERLAQQIKADAVTVQYLLAAHEYDPEILKIDERTLILIDEASKVGLRQWHALAKLRKETGARVVLVGDVGQSGAIECAGMFDVMLSDERIETALLKDVRRHRDPKNTKKVLKWMKEFNESLYYGQADQAIKLLRDNGALTVYKTREESIKGLLDTWERRRRDHEILVQDTILIVAGSNDDIDDVNELAQQRRIDARELTGEGVQAPDRHYKLYKGDVVMLREAAYKPQSDRPGGRRSDWVQNGTLGMVEEVDTERQSVVVSFARPDKTRREVTIDLRELAEAHAAKKPGETVPALRLCYAGHQYPMLGATFRCVGSLWNGTMTKEEAYAANTRSSEYLDAHADRETLGQEGTIAEALARLAKRLSVPRHRRASITYKETPEVKIGQTPVEMRRPPELDWAQRRQETHAQPLAFEQLEDYEDMLGPARTARVTELIGQIAGRVNELDDKTLLEMHRRGELALLDLNLRDGLAVQAIERDRETRTAARDLARERVQQLEAEANALSRLFNGKERSDLEQQAQAQRREEELASAELLSLDKQEQEIWRDKQHPGPWLEKHGKTLALAAAAEEELTRRDEARRPERSAERASDAASERARDADDTSADRGPELAA